MTLFFSPARATNAPTTREGIFPFDDREVAAEELNRIGYKLEHGPGHRSGGVRT